MNTQEKHAQDRLTPEEQEQLQKHEATITNAWKSNVEAAHALKEIRDKRLYRESHKTFEGYVADRFNKCRDWAYRQIRWAETADLFEDEDESLSLSEAQCRPLDRLKSKPKKRNAVKNARKIAGEQPLSAKHVEQAVNELLTSNGSKSANGSKPKSSDANRKRQTSPSNNGHTQTKPAASVSRKTEAGMPDAEEKPEVPPSETSFLAGLVKLNSLLHLLHSDLKDVDWPKEYPAKDCLTEITQALDLLTKIQEEVASHA